MGKRIDHEIRDAVLRGLKMGQEVYVHPDWDPNVDQPKGKITGWSVGIDGSEIEVLIAGEYIDVPRVALISVEVYDAFHAWGRVPVKA